MALKFNIHKAQNYMSTITDFLIDISDNMSKKLPIAQSILRDEIAPILNYSEQIGMRTFLSIAKSPIVINRIDLGNTTKSDFLEQLNKLPWPNGGTPIGQTMKESLSSLKKINADKKKIVLITSGEDTDGGNYQFEVENALKEDKFQVNIIGFDLKGFEEKTAQKVTQMTSGVFCNITADKFNNNIEIRNIIKPLLDIFNGIEPTSNNVQQNFEPKIEANIEVKEEPKTQTKEVITEQVIKNEVQAQPKAEIKLENEQEKFEQKNISNETPIIEIKQNAEPAKVAALADIPEEKATEEKEFKFEPKESNIDTSYSKNENINENIFESIEESDTDDITGKSEQKGSELAQTIADVVKNILTENADTVNILKNKISQYKTEIEKLKEVGKASLKEIEKLIKVNENANGEICSLKSSVNDASSMIDELKKLREEDKQEISNLKRIDEQVIIQDNEEKRHSNSKQSETLLFEYLQKKYPGRVKWMHQDGKKSIGYDFEITFDNEVEYYIACKGKENDEKTFFLTKAEWEQCMKNNRNYQVYLINNVASDSPKITVIDNLLGSLLNGKVRPYASQNNKVKANSVMFSLE